MKATLKLEDGREVELVLTNKQEKAIEQKKYGRQRAMIDGNYYYIDDSNVDVCKDIEYGYEVDNYRFSIGNYYLTEEEAEKAKRIQINIVKINDRIDELNEGWVPDWSNAKQSKSSIGFYENRLIEEVWGTLTYLSKVNTCKTERVAKIIISEFREELEEIFANQK